MTTITPVGCIPETFEQLLPTDPRLMPEVKPLLDHILQLVPVAIRGAAASDRDVLGMVAVQLGRMAMKGVPGCAERARELVDWLTETPQLTEASR